MAACVCVFQSEGTSGVSGALKLSQNSEADPTTFEGTIRGLTPGQKHGIALCTFGDLGGGGVSCGPIFNPFGKTHGAPSDDASLRKVGDLGNVEADESGVAIVNFQDKLVKLFGPHSVIGRSLVICAGEDDTGRGGQESSLENGNAGPRIAFGVIGIAASS
eukprot:Nitzschia sp. Nitz4//scaffold191_size41780//29632//30214//NITZ4_007473-RA/size41780-processed-gene-0.73-mRNA-1//1//CDS//3329540199//5182//frame0